MGKTKKAQTEVGTVNMLIVPSQKIPDKVKHQLDGLQICSSDDTCLYSTTRIRKTFSEKGLLSGKATETAEKGICYNCSHSAPVKDDTPDAYLDIKDLSQRLEPGGIVPSSECPKCGALMYAVPVIKRTQSAPQFVTAIARYEYLLVQKG